MFTRDSITLDVQTEVRKHMLKNGFVEDGHNTFAKLIRNSKWGYDYCFLPNVRFQPERMTFTLTVHRRINLIERVWQEWSNLLNVNIENPEDITTLYVTEKNAYPAIVKEKYFDGYGSLIFEISDDGLSQIPGVIDFILNKKIFKKLAELDDIKSIDRLLNSDLDPPSNINEIFNVDGGFMFKRMAVAKYAGNPIYEQISNLYKERFSRIKDIAKEPGKEYFLNYPEVFAKVYDRLKEVEPFIGDELI
jgi:hypothetical protein